MEQEIRLWIKEVGFPIFAAVCSMYAAFRLFTMRERDKVDGINKLVDLNRDQLRTLTAMHAESKVACKAEVVAARAAEDVVRKAEVIAKIHLQEAAEVAAKKVLDDAKAIARCSTAHTDCPIRVNHD